MKDLPGFEPINGAHAIVESIVFFDLASPPSEQLVPAISALSDKLRDEFDKSNTIQQVRFNLGAEHQTLTPAPTGVELLRHKNDGSREWVLRVSGGSISVHCLDYTRWNDVWSRTYHYLTRVVDGLSTNLPVSSVGLKVIDRFVFNGQLTEYKAELLFRRDSALLHPRAFGSGSRWHCHTGWFDAAAEDHNEVLNQLNVTSAHGKVRGADRILATVEHNLVTRLTTPRDLASYIGEKADLATAPLGSLMDRLHDGNRGVLLDLLIQEMADRINLKRKKAQ